MNEARSKTLPESKQAVLEQMFPLEDTDIHLTRGRKYLVYAIRGYADGNLFYVADDVYSGWPVPYPDFFFRIIDSRISAHWMVTQTDYEELGDLSDGKWLACEPWRNEGDFFYENLVEGISREVNRFHEIADLLEQEFPVLRKNSCRRFP